MSSSYQGLVQSTGHSGNWTLFDFSSPTALQSTLAGFGTELTDAQAACGYRAYAASGQPQFFALGTGVAGGKLTSTNSQGARAAADGFGVIAWNNENAVLGDGKGIDHMEASGIFPALMQAATTCGIDISEDG